MKKIVCVMFGGHSPEYEVSLHSAAAVLRAMDRERYNVKMLGITQKGAWYLYEGGIEDIENGSWVDAQHCKPACISPCRERGGLVVLDGGQPRQIQLDAAFPVLHGENGEDGTVQGLLALAGIPVVGCPVLPSALCMHKALAHTVAAAGGVRVPQGYLHRKNHPLRGAVQAAEGIGYPVFVKPARAGSSFGVSCVRRPEDLEAAIQNALLYDDEVLVEEKVRGFEVGCAVMGEGGSLTVGLVDEIELAGDVFDYTEKYTLKTSAIHMPARISGEDTARVRRTAATIYTLLGCSGFARVDMFLTPEGDIVFNEVNTIPGFTAHSRFPSMMAGIGYSFGHLINTLVERAVQPCGLGKEQPITTAVC